MSAQGDTIWFPWPINTRSDLVWLPAIDGVQVIGQPLELIKQGIYRSKKTNIHFQETSPMFQSLLELFEMKLLVFYLER